jgi:hypothetical protein
MNATIETNLIPIMSATTDGGWKWLKISVPNGWEDCKKLTRKVLKYNGETYVWRSWNSDYNYCSFIQSNDVVEIVKKVAKKD